MLQIVANLLLEAAKEFAIALTPESWCYPITPSFYRTTYFSFPSSLESFCPSSLESFFPSKIQKNSHVGFDRVSGSFDSGCNDSFVDFFARFPLWARFPCSFEYARFGSAFVQHLNSFRCSFSEFASEAYSEKRSERTPQLSDKRSHGKTSCTTVTVTLS